MKGFDKNFKRMIHLPGLWNLIKTPLLLAVLVCSISITGYGQNYVSNTATTVSGGNAIPWSTSFGDQKAEFIYYPGDMHAMASATIKNGYIRTVYIRLNPASTTTFNNLEVQLAQVSTSYSIASTTFYTPVATCLKATTSVTMSSSTWAPIKLTTPFLYDPTKAIIVIWSYSGFSGSGGTSVVSTSPVGGTHRIYGVNQTDLTGSGTDVTMNDFGFDIAPSAPVDAGVTSIVTPVNFCPGTYGIQVKLANLGTSAMTTCKVGWSFDGVAQTSVTWPYTIPSARDTTVTIGTETFNSGVSHNLKVWSYSPNNVADTIPLDDTLFVNGMTPAISGTYTINPAIGTGGTNFANFTTACKFLNANGICGPVLFKVSQDTFNEQVSLNSVAGVSATNTITFDGGVDSSKTIVTSGSSPTVNLSTNYVTWKHITVKNTSLGVAISLPASYCTVANGRALTDSTGTSSTSACGLCFGSGPTTASGASYNTVTHMYCSGGYYGGLTCYGTSNTSKYNTISYCTIRNGYYYGTYIYYQDHFTFSHNYLRANPATSGYIYIYYTSNAVIDGNYFYPSYYLYIYGMDYTPISGGISYITNNAFVGHSYAGTDYTYMYYWQGTKVWYNVFYETAPSGPGPANWQSCTNIDVRNNIFYRTSATQYSFTISSVANFGIFDYNDFFDAPGVSGGPFMSGTPTLQAWQLANTGKPYACANCVSADPGFKNLSAGSEDFHMCKTCYGVSGNGGGGTSGEPVITTTLDIDGQTRCQLFPNMGLDEVLTGKGAPSVNFYPTSNEFPGSPSVVFSNYKPGAPVKSTWYIQNSTYSTFTKVPAEGYIRGGDSVTLYTTKFTTGTNCLSLTQVTCGGKDSVTKCFNVAAPTAVPATDFISNKNSVVVGDIVSLHDLSTNGPQTWSWTVSPDSVIAGGAKVPSYQWTFPSAAAGSKYQNPQLKFLYPGKFTICLSTTNGVGKGPTVCKTNYINVLPTVNIGTAVVNTASGFLYDDGGPASAYVSNGGAPSTLIAPCADSVYLSFSMFDLSCNVAFLQLYEGTNVKGRRLDPCGGSGLNSGFTGGPTATCTAPCFPSVTRPDTFKAAKSMFVQMNDGASNTNFKGFAAYWWSKPSSAKRPHANFTDNGSHDSVCVNAQVNFTNTSTPATGDLNDPLTYLWDLDGDITTWECIGSCPTALWPYFLAGPTNVTLLATNCGGTDTMVKTLTVYTPKPPKASFIADNTNPSIGQTVFFSVPVAECIDDYKWTFTKSAGAGTGIATFLNGTTNISSNPQVSFSSLGYYDVKLYVDNNSGAAKDSITLKQYINVRGAYCVPSVAILNQGMGISGVTLNTLSNKTTQAQQDYTNFAGNQALTTSLALGVKYPITITRDPSLIFNAINRSVFIDWNADGLFTGPGEEAAEDSNSVSASWTGYITVPKTAKLGATIMRIAVNKGTFANLPCGQNSFGEYQDYLIYIVPYSQPPVITLTGHQGFNDTIKLEQGNCFTEPGFKATSLLYGDLTKKVAVSSGPVSYNCLVSGTYIFSYNVSDSAGNKAITQHRVVTVTKDVTPPVLVIAQPDTTVMEVTSTPLTPFPAPKVISAVDLVDGDLSSSVSNDASKVTSNILGFYTITYTVQDISGNVAKIYRYVHIIDTLPPVITLLGGTPVSVEVHTPYIESGVNITDNYDLKSYLNKHLIIVSSVDTSKIGTYKVTYYVSDSSGNQAQPVIRVVNVIDTIKPAITLNGVQFDSVDVFNVYNDPGVTVSDNYNSNSDIAVTISGTFYTQFPKPSKTNLLGTYTIIYTATDKSGNKSSVTRTVRVLDHVPPVITLKGDADLSVCRWSVYNDAGYTVSDNYNKVSEITVTQLGTFQAQGGTTAEGLLSIQYMAVDKSNNVGYSGIRNILVKSPNESPCSSSGIAPGLGLDKYISIYPNPNNGTFTINANLPTQEKVQMTITNMLGQEIAIIHNGVLGTNSFQVDLSNQVSGIYLLNIVSNNQTLTKRIEIAK